jgi:S-formylglutathione hydrolase FrmB
MAAQAIAATNVWLDGEDWSWPGARPERVELGPPAWIPTLPRAGSPAPPRSADASAAVAATAHVLATAPDVVARRFTASPPGAVAARRARRRSARRRVVGQRLLACAALAMVFAATFELAGRLQSTARSASAAGADAHVGLAGASGAAAARAGGAAVPLTAASPGALAASDPTVSVLSRDAAGASIAQVRFSSPALHRRASFLVYLPPGYRAGGAGRYPVLYLLHGDGQLADSALQLGLPSTLDTVIASGELRPLIVVIPQGAPYTYNWRDVGSLHYEAYVLETQELADRLLPTVADRDGRAIAGFSMGGYGAMNIALGHLDRFSVVESWLGFFDGLGGELRADAADLRQMPLRAFVYGGADDTIADPSENAPFAAALRGAGASAVSAVYPGGHDFVTLRAHLRHMLLFAGHALAPSA